MGSLSEHYYLTALETSRTIAVVKLQHDHDPCINDDGIHGNMSGVRRQWLVTIIFNEKSDEYDGKEKEGDARQSCSSRNRCK